MKKILNIPKFTSRDAEEKFWGELNLAEQFDREDFVSVSFPDLKPTSRSISLRIPEYLIGRVKEEANRVNIPYQSLIKQYIALGVEEKNLGGRLLEKKAVGNG